MEQQNFSPPNSVQQPSPKGIKPFWLIILLVLVVALVGVLVWQRNIANQAAESLQQQIMSLQNQISQKSSKIIATTSDENTGWKIYANNEYGYEIKYPLDWVYNEFTTPTKGEIVSFGKDKNAGELEIYSMPNSKSDESLKDWWYNNEYKILGEPSTLFGGIVQYAGSGAGGSGLSVYWKDNNYSKYTYRATMVFPSSFNYAETFQRLSFYYQMLSTFKFTK